MPVIYNRGRPAVGLLGLAGPAKPPATTWGELGMDSGACSTTGVAKFIATDGLCVGIVRGGAPYSGLGLASVTLRATPAITIYCSARATDTLSVASKVM